MGSSPRSSVNRVVNSATAQTTTHSRLRKTGVLGRTSNQYSHRHRSTKNLLSLLAGYAGGVLLHRYPLRRQFRRYMPSWERTRGFQNKETIRPTLAQTRRAASSPFCEVTSCVALCGPNICAGEFSSLIPQPEAI